MTATLPTPPAATSPRVFLPRWPLDLLVERALARARRTGLVDDLARANKTLFAGLKLCSALGRQTPQAN